MNAKQNNGGSKQGLFVLRYIYSYYYGINLVSRNLGDTGVRVVALPLYFWCAKIAPIIMEIINIEVIMPDLWALSNS